MKLAIPALLALALNIFNASAQCHYIPTTSTATDTVTYTLNGGSFQSYGCTPIDPNYWMSGSGKSVIVTFVTPQTNPSFRVWGMNDDDTAVISVNGLPYMLNTASASYDAKTLCGQSAGAEGVVFSGGKLTGANSNAQGNYSSQNIRIIKTNITSITVNCLSGSGWGFAGVTVCPLATGITSQPQEARAVIYPNPVQTSGTIIFPQKVNSATLYMYNTYGQLVRVAADISGNSMEFKRNDLPAGNYVIRVSEDGHLVSGNHIVLAD